MRGDRSGWDELPPPQLYERVAGGLRARRLMRPGPWASVRPAAIAAGLAIAFLGGRLSSRPDAGSPELSRQPEYALFMVASAAVRYPDSLGVRDRVELYRAWAAPLAAAGRLTLGEELVPRRFSVDRAGAREAPVDGGLDGMFVVRALSADSALALAGTLPHVRFGGTVMVQEVARR